MAWESVILLHITVRLVEALKNVEYQYVSHYDVDHLIKQKITYYRYFRFF